MITKDSILQRSEEVLHSDFDNEVIMMDVNTGEYHNINSVGNAIWNMLEEPISIKAICQQLIAEYNVTNEVCEAETLNFMQLMLNKKLVVIK